MPYKDSLLRQDAVKALGAIGSRLALPRLAEMIQTPVASQKYEEDEDEAILRREIVIALGRIGGGSARAVLESVASAQKEYKSVRELAREAVRRLPGGGEIPQCLNEIKRKILKLPISLKKYLVYHPDSNVVSNKWDVNCSYIDKSVKYEYHYVKSDAGFPKTVRVHYVDGSGYEVYFNRWLCPTKYAECRGGVPEGVYLEFYTNGYVRTYLNISNATIISRRHFDENGVMKYKNETPVKLSDLTVKNPQSDSSNESSFP